MKQVYFFIAALFFGATLQAQPLVYTDAQTLITGVWSGAGAGGTATLAEVTGQTPHEGVEHYRFDYNFTQWWAGLGLNMDNWGNSTARNFSGYTHLRIAYRGLSPGQTLTIVLRDGNNFGNTLEVGPSNSSYAVVDISMVSLTTGTNVNPAAVEEIDLNVTSSTITGAGTVYFDAIELVNIAGGPSAASAATNARAAALGLGVNTSNWLEAFWLIPFNAYPEFNRYTRTKVRDLRDAGFNTFRLPVTFERLGSLTPPYDLDFGHVAFDLVDSMILWANIYNFKLIIDNHHGYPLTNANYLAELPRLEAVWEQLTDHYDYLNPEQFFFEIYNEPTNEISNTNWHTIAESLIDVIRANESQTHSVLVGATSWNSGNSLIGFTPLSDPDIIYTFHNYDPYFFTHQGMSWTAPPYFPPITFPQPGEVAAIDQLFAAVKSWGVDFNVPVNLGEFGCSTQADAASRCNWVQTLTNAINTNDLSAFYWDAISPSDAFGFYTNGIINEANCIPCFKTALGLYASLPISLIDFNIKCSGPELDIRWSATTSEAGYMFYLERSNDGVQWELVKSLSAIVGNSHYQLLDIAPTTTTFYRIKTISPENELIYSPVREIYCTDTDAALLIFPNPARDKITAEIRSGNLVLSGLALFDVAGRLILENDYTAVAGLKSAELTTTHLPEGLYLLQVKTDDGRRLTRQISVMHK